MVTGSGGTWFFLIFLCEITSFHEAHLESYKSKLLVYWTRCVGLNVWKIGGYQVSLYKNRETPIFLLVSFKFSFYLSSVFALKLDPFASLFSPFWDWPRSHLRVESLPGFRVQKWDWRINSAMLVTKGSGTFAPTPRHWEVLSNSIKGLKKLLFWNLEWSI